MVITYQGGNYFKFEAGQKTLLIDPINHRSFKGALAILNTRKPSETEPPTQEETAASPTVWIDHQGEYEVGGIRIVGWTTGQDDERVQTAYRFSMDDLEVVVLGHLREELTPTLITFFRGVDILIAPAEGKPFLQQSVVAKIARQIEPGVIIPSLFSDPKGFFKEFGKVERVPEEKFVVKKKDIAVGALRIVWLKS